MDLVCTLPVFNMFQVARSHEQALAEKQQTHLVRISVLAPDSNDLMHMMHDPTHLCGSKAEIASLRAELEAEAPANRDTM